MNTLTVSASDSAELPAFVLPAWAAVDDRLPPGLSREKQAPHSHHLLVAEVAAALSQWAYVGTSGRAAPPYIQMTQQSPPSASGLPAEGDRKRPCWSGACACRIRL